MNPSAVRYYERRGLLPRAACSPSGYHVLREETVDRLRFIRQAKSLGLRLAEIREILGLRDHGEAPCKRVQELATTRLPRRFGVWRVCTGFGMIEIGFPAEGLTRRNRVQSEDLAGGSFSTRNDFW